MTYGFRPDNWPAFQAELRKRGISAADIEKIEMRTRLILRSPFELAVPNHGANSERRMGDASFRS